LLFCFVVAFGQQQKKTTVQQKKPGTLPTQEKKQAYSVYHDKIDLFRIDYPSNWEKRDMHGIDLFFIRPMEERGQRFEENMNIIIDPPDDLSLQEYADVGVEKLANQLDSFRVYSSDFVKINNMDFYKLEYGFKYKSSDMHDLFYITVKDHRSFNFTFSAIDGSYKKYYPVFQRMINSFSFEEKK